MAHTRIRFLTFGEVWQALQGGEWVRISGEQALRLIASGMAIIDGAEWLTQ